MLKCLLLICNLAVSLFLMTLNNKTYAVVVGKDIDLKCLKLCIYSDKEMNSTKTHF